MLNPEVGASTRFCGSGQRGKLHVKHPELEEELEEEDEPDEELEEEPDEELLEEELDEELEEEGQPVQTQAPGSKPVHLRLLQSLEVRVQPEEEPLDEELLEEELDDVGQHKTPPSGDVSL